MGRYDPSKSVLSNPVVALQLLMVRMVLAPDVPESRQD